MQIYYKMESVCVYVCLCVSVRVRVRVCAHRYPVVSRVFTLVWGDCYFCTEPENSIIHNCLLHSLYLNKRQGWVWPQLSACVRVCLSVCVCAYAWGPRARRSLG